MPKTEKQLAKFKQDAKFNKAVQDIINKNKLTNGNTKEQLGTIKDKKIKTLFYKNKQIACDICENTLFYKYDNSMNRSKQATLTYMILGSFQIVRHPIKTFVCRNCYFCKFVYPFTFYNRIKTKIKEQTMQRVYGGGVEDDTEDDTEDDVVTGGLGVKSSPIVGIMHNKKIICCNVCGGSIYYRVWTTIQNYFTFVFLAAIVDRPQQNRTSTSLAMYVCGECYTARTFLNTDKRKINIASIAKHYLNIQKHEFNQIKDEVASIKTKQIKETLVKNHSDVIKNFVQSHEIDNETIYEKNTNNVRADAPANKTKKVKKSGGDIVGGWRLYGKSRINNYAHRGRDGDNFDTYDDDIEEIIFNNKKIKCPICSTTKFYQRDSRMYRSKTFTYFVNLAINILLASFDDDGNSANVDLDIAFVPFRIHICKNCLYCLVKYGNTTENTGFEIQ